MRVTGKVLIGITLHPLARFLDLVARTNGFVIPLADAPAKVKPRDEVWTVNLFVPAIASSSERLLEYVSSNKKLVKRTIAVRDTTAYLSELVALSDLLIDLIKLSHSKL